MSERDRRQGGAGDFLDVEDRFAMVPEWLLDAEVSDCAVRLYAVLLRYGQSSGARMPSRATLARRLHKKSTDTVDRAMRDLVAMGAVQVQARFAGRERLTNLYRVRTSRPSGPAALSRAAVPAPPSPVGTSGAAAAVVEKGGRRNAATPIGAAGHKLSAAGSRTNAPTPAASMRHNPEPSTDRKPPPPVGTSRAAMSATCGIEDWDAFVAECVARRRRLGRPTGRWAAPCLDAALQLAVRGRSWPAELAAGALLTVARDPESRSPMRVAEAGPWWDGPAPAAPAARPAKEEVDAAEEELLEVGGLRVKLQAEARRQLATEGIVATRATVVVRAAQLLHEASLSRSGS